MGDKKVKVKRFMYALEVVRKTFFIIVTLVLN